MKLLSKPLMIPVYSFAWFLLLPFPFEQDGWRLLGGFRLIRPYLPTSDGIELQNYIGDAFYASHWYFLFLFVAACALGLLTWSLISLRSHSEQ